MYDYGQFEGLTYIGALDLEDEPWQFSIVGVWRDEEGGLYLATDSGCSCPTPWEYTQRDDLTGPLTPAQAEEEIRSLWNDSYYKDQLDVNELEDFVKFK